MQERHCYSDVRLFQHSQQARAYGGGPSARGNNRRWKVGQGGSLHAHAAHPCTLSPMLLTPAHFRPCATGFCHPGGAGRCPCRIGDDAAAPAAGAPSGLVRSRDGYLGAPSALKSRVNWLSVIFCVLGWYLSQSLNCLPPRRCCLLTPSSWTTCGSMGGSCRYGQCSRPALSSGATGWPRSSWIVLVSLDLFPSLPLPVGQCPGPER